VKLVKQIQCNCKVNFHIGMTKIFENLMLNIRHTTIFSQNIWEKHLKKINSPGTLIS